MSIITFWSNGREETGKTLSVAAIATNMAIEHNHKILIISTSYKDETLNNCFWKPRTVKRNLGIFGPNTSIAMEDGIDGLSKMIKSNKLSPENITNYTKIIFKDRLEVLPSFKGNEHEYTNVTNTYLDIINLANGYYDYVFVDLDRQIGNEISDAILGISDLIVANLNQRLSSINRFIELKEEKTVLSSNKTILLIGRYDRFSKYTIKNITRYMGERNKVLTIPYNTLFFESCEEAKVPDLFLKLRKIDEDDRNGFFLTEVKRATEDILYRIEVLKQI